MFLLLSWLTQLFKIHCLNYIKQRKSIASQQDVLMYDLK